MSNEWFERGELPPVGIECECYSSNNENWIKVKTLDAQNPSVREIACATVDESGIYGRLLFGYKFRPIRTEREKAIEAAALIIEMNHGSAGSAYKKYCASLFDAGLLRSPEDKK